MKERREEGGRRDWVWKKIPPEEMGKEGETEGGRIEDRVTKPI